MSESNIEEEDGYRDEECDLYRACSWKFFAAGAVFGTGLFMWLIETGGFFDFLTFLWSKQ